MRGSITSKAASARGLRPASSPNANATHLGETERGKEGERVFGLGLRLGAEASPMAAGMNRPNTAYGFGAPGGLMQADLTVMRSRAKKGKSNSSFVSDENSTQSRDEIPRDTWLFYTNT